VCVESVVLIGEVVILCVVSVVMTDEVPWKNGPGTNSCVFLSVNAVRSLAIALYSFLPESSQKIWSQLGLDGNISEQSWDSISEIVLDENHKIGSPSPLFAKVEDADIKKYKQKLGTKN